MIKNELKESRDLKNTHTHTKKENTQKRKEQFLKCINPTCIISKQKCMHMSI